MPANPLAILESIAAGITVQDEHGSLVFVNHLAADLAGYPSAEAMLAASPAELVERFLLIGEDGEPFDWNRLPGRRLLAGEDPKPVVVGFRQLATGEERWSMLSARPLEADGHRFAVNTFHDLTPRIAIEREARAFERRYREVIDDFNDRIRIEESLHRLAQSEHARAAELNAVIRAMGEGVFVCDAEGRIILSNPAAEDFFPNIAETTYAEVVAQIEDPEHLAPALGQKAGPIELRARGDEERWVEVRTWPVGSDEESPPHGEETIVVLRDVTDQRQRQAVRDTFLGVLSHELRTPVTTIYAGSKVLARHQELSDETRRDIFNDIVTEAERLHRLVEDVIAMTRFGEDEAEVGSEPVLLQRILPAMVSSEQARWPGVEFRLDVPAGLPTVVADPTYVEQVVRNLLSNAAKYGGRGTTIQAAVEADGDEVRVRILDNGPGFPIDEAERLFDLFFRSAETAKRAAGAGIGLFVCARLIRAMGGRVWAMNRPGRGSEFGFSLRVMAEDG